VHRAICLLNLLSLKKNSDESDNIGGTFPRCGNSVVKFLGASCSALLKYTCLETLILISRCENNINVAYVSRVRNRDRMITRQHKPIFSYNAKQSLRFRIPVRNSLPRREMRHKSTRDGEMRNILQNLLL